MLPLTKLEALEAKNKAGPFISETSQSSDNALKKGHLLPLLSKPEVSKWN